MGPASDLLLFNVHSPEREEELLLDGADGVDGQHQRLVLQHRRHVQAVDWHLKGFGQIKRLLRSKCL